MHVPLFLAYIFAERGGPPLKNPLYPLPRAACLTPARHDGNRQTVQSPRSGQARSPGQHAANGAEPIWSSACAPNLSGTSNQDGTDSTSDVTVQMRRGHALEDFCGRMGMAKDAFGADQKRRIRVSSLQAKSAVLHAFQHVLPEPVTSQVTLVHDLFLDWEINASNPVSKTSGPKFDSDIVIEVDHPHGAPAT